jgi:hypothetical protein
VPTPTLVATAGSASANSYATVAEADTYHDSRLFATDWTGAATATKTVALIMATRLLDAIYAWESWATDATQALQWPRTGILARNQLELVDSTVIPDELKNATAEFARQLIVADRSLDSDIETQGITSLRAGPVSLTFKNGVYTKTVPDAVVSLLPYWWGYVRGRSSGSREISRA